jgi:transcriptional regulator with XRE-family HTH domain
MLYGQTTTMLSRVESTLSRVTYADRFSEGLARPNKTRKGVADAMGVSVQAVGQIVNGQTKAATAENNAAAAAYFQCDPTWLATGKGSPRWSEPATRAPQEAVAEVQTVAGTISRMGELLAKANPSTRDAVTKLLLEYSQDPERGQRIAQAIELLLGNENVVQPGEGKKGTPPATGAYVRGTRIEEGVAAPAPRPRKAAS